MPVNVRPLPPKLAEKARAELSEDPQKLEDSIQHLKEWISKQPHLRVRTDDQWLATFLRGCKFSSERTKEKLDLFYSLRNVGDLYTINHRHPKFMELLKMGLFLALPKTQNITDPVVILLRGGIYPPSKYTYADVISVSNTIMRIMYMENDQFIVNGAVSISDFKDATMAHFAQMTPLMLKKFVVAVQEAAPIRMKALYYININSAYETVFNLGKSFLTEKNRSRLLFYGKDYESSLYKHIPKDIMPVEYGGSGGTVQEIIDYWVKKVEEYSDWLDEDLKFGTDESKRPGKPKTAEEMFGMEGSFRKLDFD